MTFTMKRGDWKNEIIIGPDGRKWFQIIRENITIRDEEKFCISTISGHPLMMLRRNSKGTSFGLYCISNDGSQDLCYTVRKESSFYGHSCCIHSENQQHPSINLETRSDESFFSEAGIGSMLMSVKKESSHYDSVKKITISAEVDIVVFLALVSSVFKL